MNLCFNLLTYFIFRKLLNHWYLPLFIRIVMWTATSMYERLIYFTSPFHPCSTRQLCARKLYVNSVDTSLCGLRSLKLLALTFVISCQQILLFQILFQSLVKPLRALCLTRIHINYNLAQEGTFYLKEISFTLCASYA